jgi:hypothetical protein
MCLITPEFELSYCSFLTDHDGCRASYCTTCVDSPIVNSCRRRAVLDLAENTHLEIKVYGFQPQILELVLESSVNHDVNRAGLAADCGYDCPLMKKKNQV